MLTLAQTFSYEEEIKKSRFIAQACPAATPAEALDFLQQVADPQATHNCWAYLMGTIYRFSDDGEPGGTAGRPILGAIERQGLDQVMVVVTRFYGGIKLGAGGLARAYGGVAASCLRLAPRREVRPSARYRVAAPFAHIGTLYDLLPRHGAGELQERYTPSGVELTFVLEEAAEQPLRDDLQQASQGALELVRLDSGEPG